MKKFQNTLKNQGENHRRKKIDTEKCLIGLQITKKCRILMP